MKMRGAKYDPERSEQTRLQKSRWEIVRVDFAGAPEGKGHFLIPSDIVKAAAAAAFGNRRNVESEGE